MSLREGAKRALAPYVAADFGEVPEEAPLAAHYAAGKALDAVLDYLTEHSERFPAGETAYNRGEDTWFVDLDALREGQEQ